MTDSKKYAHEIIRHPDEGETLPLIHLVRYHYAQAQAWHLTFADAVSANQHSDLALSQYMGHSHLAFLYDALAQGRSGQDAADWACKRNHSESAELVWERAAAHGLNPDEIRPYAWQRKTDRVDI
jgi:hypothetical protein